MPRTARDTALSNSLILDIIFFECDRADNARFSYVCWSWMNIALKYVWEGPLLEALFGLFAPLVVKLRDGDDDGDGDGNDDEEEEKLLGRRLLVGN